MIRCPSCGTLNQDSRKTCSNCGITLPQTQIRCPDCGTLNPLGNVLCDNCNSRLVEAGDVIPSDLYDEPDEGVTARRVANGAGVKGISLPTRSPGDDESAEEELPDWLRELAPGGAAYDDDFEASEPPDAKADEATYPDWLSDLLEDSDAAEGPMASDEGLSEDETADDLSFDPNALPDWFAEAAALNEEQDEPDVDFAQASESALPDWLATYATDDRAQDVVGDAEESPDWLMADVVELPADVSEAPSELPSWLGAGEVEAEPEVDLLEAEPVLFPESELPDWLTEAQSLSEGAPPTEAAAEATTEPEDVSEAEDDLLPEREDLASLLDFEATEAEEAEEPPELPDWLLESETETEAGTELPDWLTALAEEEELADTDEPATPSPIGPPEEDESSELNAVEAGDTAPGESAPEPEAPADLEQAALPEWLAGLDVEEREDAVPTVFAGSAPARPPIAPGERPDWLDEIEPPTAEADREPGAPAFLLEVTEEEDALGLGAPADEPVEVPEWLRDLDLGPAEAQAIPMPEDDRLARAELPNWLQELAPSELALETGTTEVFDVTDELVSADIPDWVKALKPSPDQERAAPVSTVPLPTPAEPEGPLEGIPGVLQPLATVDVPAGSHPVAEMPVPEGITAQAQLWQQLLEQPRMAERPVFHERPQSGEAAVLVRLLVAAVFILGLLAAFWLLPEDTRLSSMLGSNPGNPGVTAPGAASLVEAFDDLQPGDGVIVAVEFGNAYAEEMLEVASPLLDHLAAQETVIQVVSTLPEGVLLGPSLSGSLPEVLYLAGNANGIAGFLAQPDSASQRHLLILASGPQRVRWWLEQATLANEGRAVPLTVSAGVSAAAGPQVAPYLQSETITGWVTGLPDALAYRTLRTDGGTARAEMSRYGRIQDILALAHWAAGAFLVLGLLVNLVRRDRQSTGTQGRR